MGFVPLNNSIVFIKWIPFSSRFRLFVVIFRQYNPCPEEVVPSAEERSVSSENRTPPPIQSLRILSASSIGINEPVPPSLQNRNPLYSLFWNRFICRMTPGSVCYGKVCVCRFSPGTICQNGSPLPEAILTT